MIELYQTFFRNKILRKRATLLNPLFHNTSEIHLPKNSLFVFQGKHDGVVGPSNEELFISNYTNQVNIEFSEISEYPIGKVRKITFDRKKLMTNYLKGHYKYVRVRNPATPLGLDKQLYVINLSLADKQFKYLPNRFTNFEKSYNNLSTLIAGINDGAKKSDRNLFVHFELPPGMPGWSRFKTSYEHYKECFDENGVFDAKSIEELNAINVSGDEEFKQVRQTAIIAFMDYNAYWLMDWFSFLLGEYKYSQFSKLNDDVLKRTNMILSYNSRCLILNLGLLKSWLEELNKNNEPGPKRLNVTKRIMLMMVTMINDGTPNLANEETEKETELTNSPYGNSEDSPINDDEVDHNGQVRERTTDQEEDLSSSSKPVQNDTNLDTLSSLFTRTQGDEKETNGAKGTQGNARDNGESSGTASEVNADEELDWTSIVDDKLLEEINIEIVEDNRKHIFNTPVSGIELALKAKAKEGTLTVAEQDFYLRKANSYKTIKLSNGQTVEQFMKIDKHSLTELSADSHITANLPNVLDKSMLKSKATQLKLGYVEKFLKKDIINSIMAVQNAGICVTSLEDEEIVNAEGAYDIYKVQLTPINGSVITRNIRCPKVGGDGIFMVDGVKLVKETQRIEIPIRKINEFTVTLSSYYDKRLMVRRSQKVADDYAYWLAKQIISKGEDGTIKVTLGNVYDHNTVVPRTYSIMAKRFKNITLKSPALSLNFDYKALSTEHPEVKEFVTKYSFPIGYKGDKVITLDEYGNVQLGGNDLGTIESLLGIDIRKAPIETVTVNINGYNFPIGVVLCYYFGIDDLLKVLKSEYRTIPMGERPNLTEEEFALVFSDEYLIFNKRDKLSSFVFGGLRKLTGLSNFSRFDLNNKGVWVPIMGDPKVKPTHFKEMKNIFDMFVDPITKGELERLKYPTSIHYLLIEAIKLLLVDYTKHEVSIEEQRLAGYETFAGHVYRELCKSIRHYRNKPEDRRNTVDLNPEAVIMAIITDTSVNQVEEANPVHQIKDQEEVTFGGTGGRSEITMTRRTRGQQNNYRGIISEAGKDSSKVGFIQYMTSDPKVIDYRGNIDTSMKESNTSYGSVVMNLFYGSTNDDPKRQLYAGTQASQAMAASNYVGNSLRTGYDTVLAHRTSELYSKVAKQDGKVTKLTKEGLIVTYKDGTEDSYPLGLIIGKASGEDHRHTRVTDLQVGDKFKEGDVIGWDEQFFERDIGCPGQVVWKCGGMTRIALMENQFTFEDSFEISSDFAKGSSSHYIKSKKFIMDFEQRIGWRVKVGDDVDYESILCDIEDPHTAEIEDNDFGEFDELNRLGIKQVKSNHHGKVVKIDIVYNGDVNDMSPSAKEMVLKSNKERTITSKFDKSGVKDGNIGGNVNVKKVPINPGKIAVTIYIEDVMGSTTADKFVIGNQMKGTTGNVFTDAITTLDGRKIDIIFSCKSIYNRMVVSIRDKLVTNELGYHVTKEFIKVYRESK